MGSEQTSTHLSVCGYPVAVNGDFAAGTSAPTILALHGFTGSGDDFLPLKEALGPGLANWICPDFMGHGRSACPPVLDPYTLPACLSLIDQARGLAPDPDKLVLLGYSMGGRLALHYLRWANPLPVILIGCSPGLLDPGDRAKRRKSDSAWISLLQSSLERFCVKWEEQPLINPQTLLPDPIRSALLERRRQNNPVGLVHSLLGSGTGVLPSLWNDLTNLPPLTLVHGQNDEKFGKVASEMQRTNQTFSIRSVPGCGHAPHLEKPALLAEILRETCNSLLLI